MLRIDAPTARRARKAHGRRTLLLFVSALAVLACALPGLARADAVRSVSVDDNSPPPGTPTYVALNGYFPGTITVHAGEAVQWTFKHWHMVIFTPGSQNPPDLAQFDPLHPYSGYNDAAGVPFWFNASAALEVPTGTYGRVGGAVGTSQQHCAGAPSSAPNVEDGTQFRNSGFPVDGTSPPAPYTLCFPTVGTYKYYCIIHRGHTDHGMFGVVNVVPTTTTIPTAKQNDAQAAAERSAAYANATQLDNYNPGANTVSEGHDGSVASLLKFFPSDLSVGIGTTVTFSISSLNEVHVAAFGPEAYRDANENKFVTLPSGEVELNPMIFLPSDPPPVLPPYTGLNHGNGWENTGATTSEAPDPTKPTTLGGASHQITYTTAGDYVYECLIHPGMEATIHVH
jgi:plastocyanin